MRLPENGRVRETVACAYAKSHPYKSFVPPDSKPALEQNEKLMNQYRPLTKAFYLEPR